ncbi:MAG: SDR family oxidoreductase [Gemmatimonadetes bacterium]|nr:SDR family oxidoreductase [Gemmatimonadota bacterium]
MAKRILITGCSSGFGLDATKTLARKGHHVYATMRAVDGRNARTAEELSALAESEGVSITVHDMDVTSDASVEGAVSQMDGVDVLINNAGYGYGGPVESFEGDEILAQLDLNIVGTARVANAVLPGMRAAGDGLIIQVSSTAGRAAFPGFGVYHASKWGLEGMSEAMRYELAPLGIDVVIVEPGPFETNFFDNMKQGSRQDVMASYGHVGEFFAGFQTTVGELFESGEAPTDSRVVVDIFDRLVDMPKGERPIRTIAGLDFGFQALNDATDPIRKAALESMGIADWDGARG